MHVDSWRETYSGVLDDRFFSEQAFARRLNFWTHYLELVPRPGRLAVAEGDGVIIGFANSGASAGPDALHGFRGTAVDALLDLFACARTRDWVRTITP